MAKSNTLLTHMPKYCLIIVLLLYHQTNYHNATVATYQMNYGKGKIINLGIWGHELITNAAFLNYFDNVIMPIALGSTDKISSSMK